MIGREYAAHVVGFALAVVALVAILAGAPVHTVPAIALICAVIMCRDCRSYRKARGI